MEQVKKGDLVFLYRSGEEGIVAHGIASGDVLKRKIIMACQTRPTTRSYQALLGTKNH